MLVLLNFRQFFESNHMKRQLAPTYHICPTLAQTSDLDHVRAVIGQLLEMSV